MRLLVNIRGCNGAGKSTIPMLMMEQDHDMKVVGLGPTGKAPYISIFPNFKWIALGTYYNKTGGLDTYGTNADTKLALDYVMLNYPKFDILMEGVIASTIKSTYANWFHEAEKDMRRHQIPERKIIIMSMLPPVQTCIDRVYARNGGKPVKEDQIISKWNTVDRNVQYFKDEGFISLRVDTSKVKREKMLKAFLRSCERTKEELAK